MEKIVRVKNGSFYKMVAFWVTVLGLILGSIFFYPDGDPKKFFEGQPKKEV